MRRLLLILPAVVALLVAGCGSSKKTESASSLRTKADAICAVEKKQTDADAGAKNPDLDKALKDTKAAVDKLAALKPPSDLKTDYATYTTKLQAAMPLLGKLVKAVDAKDAKTAQALESQVDKAGTGTQAAAAKVGLKECAKD